MKIVVKDEKREGLEKFLGSRIELTCCRYIYAGDLTGINDSCIKLENGGIVFETGPFTDKDYKDYQDFESERYIMLHSIESFGPAR